MPVVDRQGVQGESVERVYPKSEVTSHRQNPMTTPTLKSQEARPVYCANCYTPMTDLHKGAYFHWWCETCGLEHKQDKGDKA